MTDSIKRKKGSGIASKTSKKQDSLIIRLAKKNPFLSSRRLSDLLSTDYSIELSHTSVSTRLNEADLPSYISRKRPMISPTNQVKRLNFARKHVNWKKKQWQNTLFSDESPFSLFASCGRQFVRRPKSQALNPKYVLPTVKHGGGKIQVWGLF